jgi:hypothetical protein
MHRQLMHATSQWHCLLWGMVISLVVGVAIAAADDQPAERPPVPRPKRQVEVLDPIELDVDSFQWWLQNGLGQPGEVKVGFGIPDQKGGVPLEYGHTVLDQILYGPETTDAAAARQRLEAMLKERIDLVHRLCDLSDAQREKLELSGRGDIQRFVRRAEKLREELPKILDTEVTREFARETWALHELVAKGAFGRDSLFGKSLHRMLTPKQSADIARRSEELPPSSKKILKSLPLSDGANTR